MHLWSKIRKKGMYAVHICIFVYKVCTSRRKRRVFFLFEFGERRDPFFKVRFAICNELNGRLRALTTKHKWNRGYSSKKKQNHELIHQYLLAVHLTTDMEKGWNELYDWNLNLPLTSNLTSYTHRRKEGQKIGKQ